MADKMGNEIDQMIKYFSDEKNINETVTTVRQLYNTRTTEKQAQAGYKALQIALLYCPEDQQEKIEAAVFEFEWRMTMFGINYHYGEGV